MIIKSMSRKVPSFGQLLEYIDRDEGQGAYNIRHNLAGRKAETIRSEFERNGALLRKRKNGVYLYHEIISITRAKGLSPEEQKQRLHQIAQDYINARCPDNLAYAGLHQDKDHSYHMHLMISANRVGEQNRYRVTKHQFRQIQVQLEEHVLQTYPELEQKLAIGKRSDRGRNKGEAELERRTGQRPKREIILERVQTAFAHSDDRQSLLEALGMEGLELYVRGKTLGVVDLESGKKHRLKTLDLEIADRVAIRMEGGEVERPEPKARESEPEMAAAPEPEEDLVKEKPAGQKEKEVEPKRKRRRKETTERKPKKRRSKTREPEPESTRGKKADNEDYVTYGSNTDLNNKTTSKQTRAQTQEKDNPMQEPDNGSKNAPDEDVPEWAIKAAEKMHGSKNPLSLTKLKEMARKIVDQGMEEARVVGKLMRQGLTGHDDSYQDIGGETDKPKPHKAKGKAAPERAERSPRPDQQSEQQKAWRRESEQRRDQERGKGRDGPNGGRE